MERVLMVLVSFAFVSVAHGQILAERPELVPGESWSYERTDVKSSSKLGAYTVTVVSKRERDYEVAVTAEGLNRGVPERISLDLNRITRVDGQEMDGGVLRFPLDASEKSRKVNESWIIETGKGQYDIAYHVVGKEAITMPLGKFDTVKIVGEGWWNMNLSSGFNRATNTIEFTYWYAPELKGMIRVEAKNAGGLYGIWRNDLVRARVHDGAKMVAYGTDPQSGATRTLERAIEGVAKDTATGVGVVTPK
jgi:hypothetical protein